jgi:hypothetical protein
MTWLAPVIWAVVIGVGSTILLIHASRRTRRLKAELLRMPVRQPEEKK